ncbi:MAG: hypothetical protein ABR586_06880, partial [Thermoplasmatota archaeon]
MTHWLATLPLAALLCLTGAATASPLPLPPMDFQAAAGPNGTVELSWSPPLDAAGEPLSYAVYADGVLATILHDRHLNVALGDPVLYSVTALAQDGGESLPAFLLVGHLRVAPAPPIQTEGPLVGIPGCPPLGTDIYT